MKTRYLLLTYLAVCILTVALCLHYGHTPIQMTEDGVHWKDISPISRVADHTYVIHCQKGQYFRICENKPTLITSFAPDANGYALITYVYTNKP